MKRIRLMLTPLLLIASARSLHAQRGDPEGELVVGTYHFTTNGSMRYVEQLQNQTNTYTDGEDSEWDLRFYRSGRYLMMNTHARRYTRVSTETIAYRSGGLDSVVKRETWSYDRDKPAQIGNLKRVVKAPPLRGPLYRALIISNDPLIEVWHQTVVTKYYRGARPETIPYPEQHLELHASLEVDWDQAQWAGDYRGRLTALNRASQYISRDKKKWLRIDADWDLQPAR